MKIALVSAPVFQENLEPHMGLAYIQAMLEEKNHEVQLHEINIEMHLKKPDLYYKLKRFANLFSFQTHEVYGLNIYKMFDILSLNNNENRPLMDAIREHADRKVEEIMRNKPDVIGLNLNLANCYYACYMGKKFVEKGVLVIMGGPLCLNEHITILLRLNVCKYIVKGEGEETIVELLNIISKKGNPAKVKGIAFLSDNKEEVHTEARPLVRKIDLLPFPTFEKKHHPLVPICSSRGCINKCTYCMESLEWQCFRQRSVKNTIEEMKFRVKNKQGTHFTFNESLINGNPKWLEEFCDELIKQDLGITWEGPARPKNLSPELLKKIKKSGCKLLAFGVESFDDDILKAMNKKITADESEETLLATYNSGLGISFELIVGFPGETNEQFLRTVKRTMNIWNKTNEEIKIHFQELHLLRNNYMYSFPEKFGIKLINKPIYAPQEYKHLELFLRDIAFEWDAKPTIHEIIARSELTWLLCVNLLKKSFEEKNGDPNVNILTNIKISELDNILSKFLPQSHYFIDFWLEEKDMNEETGRKIISFLKKLTEKRIQFKIDRPLPPCLMITNHEKIQYEILEDCYNCRNILMGEKGNKFICKEKLLLFSEEEANHTSGPARNKTCDVCHYRAMNNCYYSKCEDRQI